MPVVTIVVGAIAKAAGASLLMTAVATGVAGGVVSMAMGGSFGDGFKTGAIGGLASGLFSAGMSAFGGAGDAVGGATIAADGTTTAEMLAAQGGAEFAPDAFSGMGDIGATGASVGFGELGGTDAISGAETYGLGGIDAPVGTELGAAPPAWEQGLQDTVNMDQFGVMSEGASLASSAGFNAAPTSSLGTDQFSMTPDMGGDSFLSSPDASYAPQSVGTEGVGGTSGGLDNIGQVDTNYNLSQGTSSGSALGSPIVPDAAGQTINNSTGLGGMFKTSDAWLKNTFGQSAPSTSKLLMGGGQALYDKYQIDKQARQAKGMAPMSFEEYQRQFTNPQDYRNASAKLAQSGRTGTLPALLARMNERARQGYASYLPGAKEKQYEREAGIQANRNASLSRLFGGLGYGA